MSTYSNEAIKKFSLHYNCAQAVFSTYAPLLGVDEKTALKLSCGFGGGMGRMQEVCGAATGAYMLIGGKYGMTDCADQPSKFHTYDVMREFTRKFLEKNGALHCRDLLGCEMTTEEGMEYIRINKKFETTCRQCIECASNFVEEKLFHDELIKITIE